VYTVAQLQVTSRAQVAEDIHLFEFRDPAGAALAGFTAGAHVQVTSPQGLARKYSLCNDPAETGRYVVAVKRDAAGRGGSVDLVDHTRVGDLVEVGEPHNAFALDETAPGFIFIAGGIGITPIMSMLRRCLAIGAPFRLYYCTRSPEHTPFREELAEAGLNERATIHHDGGDRAKAFDLWAILEKPTREHIYCCGPRPMLEDVHAMTGHWPPASVHFESFVDAAAGAEPQDRAFTVVLARSGERVSVPVGVSILEAIRARGHDAPSSCESGTCGTCRTRLVSGVADHRDFVLMEEEHADQIMICVSRARSAELTIDR
jgi:phthalate 4,5-dioxygenase reductase component